MRAIASRAGAPAAANRASTNPWLIAVLVAFATFMEVLDTTIANVALPYIAGGLGRQRGRGFLGGDHLSRRQRRQPDGKQFFRAAFRSQAVLPHLLGTIHRKFGAVRFRAEPQHVAVIPYPAGARRRRHGAGVAVDPCGFVSAGEARPGISRLFGIAVVVAPVVGPTLGGWTVRQFVLAVVPFSSTVRSGVVAIVLISSLLRESARRGGGAAAVSESKGSVRSGRLRAGRDISRRARNRARPRAHRRLVRFMLHRRDRCGVRTRFRSDDPWE